MCMKRGIWTYYNNTGHDHCKIILSFFPSRVFETIWDGVFFRSRYTTRLRTLWGSLVLINKRGMRNLIYSFFSETASCAKNIALRRYIYICGAINIYIYGEREREDAVVRCTLQRCRILPLSLYFTLSFSVCVYPSY